MLRVLVRAVLAAALFVVAVQVVPELAWAPHPSPVRIALVLGVLAAANGLTPAALRRVGVPPPGTALVVLGMNAAFVIGLAWVSGSSHGLRLAGLLSRPADAILAVAVVAAVVTLGVLASDRVRVSRPWVHSAAAGGTAASAPSPASGAKSAVLLIFLLSGAAGLIYEVVWARQLVLVFGNTTQAVSAILTGYFGGLAIGSVVGGRIADRVRRPLRMYGILELFVVAVVLVTPVLFGALHEVYRSGYAALELQPTTLALIRYVLALAALAPATVLMGATLPTLSRHLSRSAADLGGSFGRLYAVNTVGAVAGTLVSGLVLIELLGLSGALLVGAISSAGAGVAALILDRRGTPAVAYAPASAAGLHANESPRAAVAPAKPAVVVVPAPSAASVPAASVASVPAASVPAQPDAITSAGIRRVSLAVAFVSGLTSLGYQVLWTRLLASGSGNSTYVFTLILATFLVGLALGAIWVARRQADARRVIAELGMAQLAVATIALAGIPVLTSLVATAWPLPLRVILVVLPGTLAMGVSLPLASSLIAVGHRRVGQDAGLLLGINTAGAIIGTFLVPFAAIPVVGSSQSVVLLAAINAALGTALLGARWHARTPAGRALPAVGRALARRAGTLAGGVLLTIAAVGLVIPNGVLVDPGMVRMGRLGTVLSAKEDEIAAVQAGVMKGRKALWVGGTGMTTLTVDAKLMALMPEFVRPSARRMLVIAMGMGSSFEMGLTSGLTVDGVELVPSVPGMLGFFQPNAGALQSNPRGRIVIADGRNYVELTSQTYDIVIVDPPPPIESSGTVVLYSQQFYLAAAARLNAGGVMMEWMPGSQSVDEFRAHVRTFASVFPNVLLAFGPAQGGVFMLGSSGPVALDPAAIAAVLARPGVVADLAAAPDTPVTTLDAWEALIPALTWRTGAGVASFGGSGPLITDDRPSSEYYLLRRTFAPSSPRMTPENLRAAQP